MVVKKLPRIDMTHIKWVPVDDESTPYIVREVLPDVEAVYLEEGVIGYYRFLEIAMNFCYVREVQAPGEICVQTIVEESMYEKV